MAKQIKTYKLSVSCGDAIQGVIEIARKHSREFNVPVEFKFNDVKVIVDKNSDPKLVIRDYHNAYLLDWKKIGPEYLAKYDSKLEKKIAEAKEANRIASEEAAAKYAAHAATAKEKVLDKIKDVEFEFKDREAFDEWSAKNTDPYGARCFSYALEWGSLMQLAKENGESFMDCSPRCSREADYDGITGFMYSVAQQILKKHWALWPTTANSW